MEVIVLTSPACPYCPPAKKMAEEAVKDMENVELRHVSVTEKEGQELAKELGIMGVPDIIINGELVFEGVPPDVDRIKKEIKKRM